MESKTQWQIFLISIAAILIIIPPFGLLIFPEPSVLYALIRLTALWGFIGLAFSSALNLNKKVLYQKFGLKFLKVHHYAAIFALVMTTLHPVLFAIFLRDISVFVPNFDSWVDFWALGGRPAFILIAIAVIAALFRKFSKKVWKYLHQLIYVALIMIFVHAIIIGTDFQSIFILVFYCVIFVVTFATYPVLRIQNYMRTQRTDK
jgi:predicted ferric reductase